MGQEVSASWDEPVHLSDYRPEWPDLFATEAERISRVLPELMTIEHIGSTAVPGLPSKPIVDLMVGVGAQHELPEARRRLVESGYEDLGEAGVPGRIYLRQRSGQPYNIALVLRCGPIWNANLALREYLRTHPHEVHRYAEIKRSAVEGGAGSLLAYSAYKAAFLSGMIRRALRSGE